MKTSKEEEVNAIMRNRGWDSDWDRKMGLHSNIPACCVDEYVSCMKAFNGPEVIIEMNKVKRTMEDAFQLFRPGYVLCWTCLYKWIAGQIVPNELHICTSKEDSETCNEFISLRESYNKEAGNEDGCGCATGCRV